ncbi:holin [Mycobacterium phage LittleGuy]|uniref:Holin n=1 Tax=Mycobacterium phage Nyxis TaxID=1445714 RepID=W0LP50_9CAUD|nr:holin [Mycobacterium phage Nyxis]AHG24054.1 holin [Mycobacterium phage Nyxis]AOT27429.1 holin [Mycobacterium phage LittleGuy]QAY10531.1 holin [Mycobacterium phage Phontbonne]
MSPKVRETLYYLGTIIPGVVGIALIWGGLDAGSAESIGDILVGVLTLLGASAPAVAAKKVNEQRKDGTLLPQAPVDQVVSGVTAILETQAKAQAELDRVKSVVAGAASIVPGVGPLAAQVINSIPTAYSQVVDYNRQPWDR